MKRRVFSNQIQIFHANEPTLIEVEPTFGDVSGRETIYIHGTGFESAVDISCVFDEIISSEFASFVSPTLLTCQTPPHIAGNASVGISYFCNFVLDGGLKFEYIPQPTITSIYPSLGPIHGATSIRVSMTEVRSTETLSCKFGSIVSSAKWVSATEILCFSPPQQKATTVQLQVSHNQDDFQSQGVEFEYFAEVELHHAYPGLALPGESVFIFGKGFIQTPALKRRINGDAVVAGTFVNASCVLCKVDAFYGALAIVEISLNGVDFSRNGVYVSRYFGNSRQHCTCTRHNSRWGHRVHPW